MKNKDVADMQRYCEKNFPSDGSECDKSCIHRILCDQYIIVFGESPFVQQNAPKYESEDI